MKRLIFIVLLALVGCAPSQQSIQTAIIATQMSWTSIPSPTTTTTPSPTVTPTPTATVISCSDNGWSDIAIYLRQFDQEKNNLVVGTSKSAYLASLENTKSKINDVKIDACSEHARQTIISGLSNEIYGYQILFTGGSADDGKAIFLKGTQMVVDAKTELENLGININYP
jgi:hypothetical protein